MRIDQPQNRDQHTIFSFSVSEKAVRTCLSSATSLMESTIKIQMILSLVMIMATAVTATDTSQEKISMTREREWLRVKDLT